MIKERSKDKKTYKEWTHKRCLPKGGPQALGLCLMFALLVMPGHAQVYYSSLGANNSFSSVDPWCITGPNNTECGPAVLREIAASFTPSASFTLQGISLPLGYATGTNSAQIVLAQDGGGIPGKSLETWTLGNLPGGAEPALTAAADSLNLTLQAGQKYWVEVLPGGNDTLLVWYKNNLGLNGGTTIIGSSGWQPLTGTGTQPAFSVAGVLSSGSAYYSSFGSNDSFSTSVWCVSGPTNPNCGPTLLREIAAPFTPSATFALQSISLPLSYNTGTNGAVVSIAQDSSGSPGSTLESWTVTGLPLAQPPALTVVNDKVNLMLQGGAPYWLVVQPMANDTLVAWNRNTLGLSGGLSNNGSGWQALSASALPAFDVSPVRSSALSQIAAGGGWTTVISLENSSLLPITVSVQLHANDGTPLTLPLTTTQQGATQTLTASSINATLNPNTTFLISTGDGIPSVTVAWADVLSTGPVGGSAIFRSTPSSGSPSEGTASLQTQSPYLITMAYDNTAGFILGVALANLSPASQTIVATMWDANGNQLGAPQPIAVAGEGHASFALTTQFPQTIGEQGIVQFSSAGGLAGLGLRFSPFGTFTSVPATIPGQ